MTAAELSNLRALAKAAKLFRPNLCNRDWVKFHDAANPSTVLALIGRIDELHNFNREALKERDEARREAEKWRKRAHEVAPNNTIKIWPDPLHPWEESAKEAG